MSLNAFPTGPLDHRQVLRRGTKGLLVAVLALCTSTHAGAQNEIQIENALPGNPKSEWDLPAANEGDPSIQGFATDISVDQGGTIGFKINVTDAASYGIKIYRLGYYGGSGARLIADLGTFTGVAQPACISDPALTGLMDCGNWSTATTWSVPANAVSGIYLAKLTRTGNGGASHIAFIVRDDDGNSEMLFKTSDATWQAYNGYTSSLYSGSGPGPGGNAWKVSYNRPFRTRGGGGGSGASEDWLFNAEYPMIRWMERNGYDVSYTTDLDHDRNATPYTTAQHKVLLSVGHDEYWSANEWAKWEGSRNNGVHLAFFSGNEVYWKTRWENSIDGSGTPHRTLVCYKEGTLGENDCGIKCDPLGGVWTGLWRDGCTPPYAANDGCRPENALTGQISWVGTTLAIQVPDTYKNLRFWRNTSVALLSAGQTKTLTSGSLGYEWDQEQPAYASSYPRGRILLSSTTQSGQTHKLSLYRHSSGALVFGAGTVQWSWGLDAVHDGTPSTVDTDMQQATINLFADMGVQPGNALLPPLVAATASTDVTAPTTVITAPLHASTSANNSTVVITGTAADVGGVVAGVEVSVDGGTTWQVATGTTAWSFNWVPSVEATYVIKSRAFDDSGNMEIPGTAPTANAISVTISGTAPCPCSLFATSDVPAIPLTSDNAIGIEVGMKFRTTASGYITAVRFYKGAGTTGTHTAHLWSASGTLLGSGSFTAETASGWQETNLDAAVQVIPGTTYVVSCHSTSGQYAVTNPYFTVADVNSPLRGLANGEDGTNGVYIYTAAPAFPTFNYQTSNYWVDVVFAESVGTDVTAPVVTNRTPAPGATNVAAGTTITATFNEAMNAATMIGANFVLSPAVAGAVSYNAGTRTITFDPTAALAYATNYTATLSTNITDVADNPLASAVAWSFTTQAEPPPPPPLPTEGPGGPILLISASTNPFSRYPVEILRAEGFNAFDAVDVSTVTSTVLNAHDVVVLGDIPVSGALVGLLDTWVNAGGTLIALRPEAGNTALQTLLGLAPAGGSTAEGYLLINTASAPGTGLVNETIQFHGTADHYTLTGGATSVATLYSNATTATTFPAVTKRLVGSNGGSASAFTYDLARSVVYSRQGNPAWAGQNRETTDGVIRSNDLFHGNASGDPQTDWVNLDKAEIPQADEQQHLLSNLITLGSLHRKPMPRFWFLPSKHKAAVVMTGDDHGSGLTASFFDDFITQSGSNNTALDVTNWTAVRGSSYMYPNTPLPLASALNYQSQGFEVGIHVNTGCNVWTPASMLASYTSDLAAFATNFPGITAPSTHRTHCIAWSDFSSQPAVEVTKGIRLDVNYYYWPDTWLQNRPGLFTGSGLPMRFAEADGDLINCFQVTTQFTDESGQAYPLHYQTLIDNALGAEGYYGVFCANFHTDRQSSRALAAGLIDYAQLQSPPVPVISARQMLTWLDGRNASTYSAISFSGTTLSFTASVGVGADNLYGMLPVNSAVGALSGISNGGPVAFTTETIKGIPYAFFPVTNGTYTASYAPDLTAPVITSVVATPNTNGTATITWTTDEPASSRVDYGTDPGPLTLNSTSAALVTSHSVVLYGLALNTTYNFRVTSVDGASNSASQPVSPGTLSFTMPNGLCAQDDLAADFSLGTPDANTLVVTDNGGAVILKPTTNEAFDGNTVPAGWQAAAWGGGSTPSVNGGAMTLSGGHAATTATFTNGSTIEFVATFRGEANQHIGFTADFNFSNPWAIFSTMSSNNALYARVNSPGGITDNLIANSSSLIGSSHRYRLVWKAASFEFYVDDVLVSTISGTISSGMLIHGSDLPAGAQTLTIDWLRASPYATAGSYTSRVFNQGAADGWGVANWTASVPSGTSLAMLARTGNSATPDGSWTAFVPLTNGAAVGGGAQYLQYRADLATTDNTVTPVLNSMSVACGDGPDLTPPVITNVVATPAPDGLSATITWTTDEAANSLVDYGTVAGTLGQSVSGAALVLSHSLVLPNLVPGTTYFYRVTSVDLATNASSSPIAPATLSFTAPVPAPPPCMVDDEAAEFVQGSFADTHLSLVDDGVILKPRAVSEFTTLPPTSEWDSYPWTGGTSTVSGGVLSVDGARYNVNAATTFGPGSVLEFVATFNAANFQNIGFAAGTDAVASGGMFNDLSNNWAVFGVPNNGAGSLYARTLLGGGTESNVLIPGSYIGTAHRYRIEWNASNVLFYVDGTLVHTATVTIGGTMRPAISDYTNGGAVVQVDWIRATPYLSPGTFTSRVHDQGAVTSWTTINWTATVPTNTTLALSVRTGNTAVPDGSWTGFVPVTNGGTVGATSRYIQYQASLATTDPLATALLQSVSIGCGVAPPAAPVVILQPTNAAVCEGIQVDLTAAASGNPTPTVQWEVSTNGGSSWSPVSGATSATLTLTTTAAMNGQQYHAVFTNGVGTPATSSAAVLTVRPLPVATLSAVDPSICTGMLTQLRADATSGTGPFSLVVNGLPYASITSGVPFTVAGPEVSIWANPIPGTPADTDGQPIEVGVKFRASTSGYVTGVRFYKGALNTGTHIGNLWASTGGAPLATATFTNETASGWQEVRFSSPVAVLANTTYIASYYSDGGYFAINNPGLAAAVTNGPLTALAAGTDGPNGVFKYGGGFPNGGVNANYWVDVLFTQGAPSATYQLTQITDAHGCISTGAPLDTAAVVVAPLPGGSLSAPTTACVGTNIPLTFTATSGTGPFDLVVNGTPYTNVVSGTPFATPPPPAPTPSRIWSNTTPTPIVVDEPNQITLGVKFRSTTAGQVTAIRFFKGWNNAGPQNYIVKLWSDGSLATPGTVLGQATTSLGDSDTGWQEVVLSPPVTIQPNTTYIASFLTPQGNYVATSSYFNSAYNEPGSPLTALSTSAGPNGVFVYDYQPGFPFPSYTFNASNYWVDVVFTGSSSVPFTLSSITDANGCTASGASLSSTSVSVVPDGQAPVALCKNATVVLSDNGSATITGADLDNGSTDNCSIASLVPSQTTFSAPGTFPGITLTVTDGAGLTNTCTSTVTVQNSVQVALTVFLDGPYDDATDLMKDDLRTSGLIPAAQPYTTAPFGHSGTETVASMVLTVTGTNAIVDWVLVELRSSTNPQTVVARRAALLQRDGHVVDVDGVKPVLFPNVPNGSYHVAIRHRNHFGAMTLAAQPLVNLPVLALDLSTLPTHGADAMKPRDGRNMLWAGNADLNTLLRYTGFDNDRDVVLVRVGGDVPSNVIQNVYAAEDVNMDGDVIFVGTANDRDRILQNIPGPQTTTTRRERLP